MKLFWKVGLFAAVCALALVAWNWRWLAREPALRGRTVTEWLDAMALFDEVRQRDQTEQTSFNLTYSPAVVTNDPAVVALTRLGSNAAPVLVKRLTDPPQWSKLARVRQWVAWKWEQTRSSGAVLPPRPPVDYSSRDEARKMSAALALLALGTNQGGGIERLADVVILTSTTNLTRGTGFSPGWVLMMANSGLPDRGSEMIDGVERLLDHPNPGHRRWAAYVTRSFVEAMPRWRQTLVKRATEDSDVEVRTAALWALAAQLRGDPEIVALCTTVLENRTNSVRWRRFAAAGLGMGGAAAAKHLPLLQEVLLEKDSTLQREARTAIREIQRALNAAPATASGPRGLDRGCDTHQSWQESH